MDGPGWAAAPTADPTPAAYILRGIAAGSYPPLEESAAVQMSLGTFCH